MWEFLSPYNIEGDIQPKLLAANTRFYTGKEFELSNYDIAIVGIEEYRGNELNIGCRDGNIPVRNELYKLYATNSVALCDLGNIKKGAKLSDSRYALQEVITTLLKEDVIPIIIGGDGSLMYDQHYAYKALENPINIVDVNERIKLLEVQNQSEEINIENWLIKAFSNEDNHIFNYSLIAYQSYFNNKEDMALINKMQFEAYRLGVINEDIKEIEPIVRDADMVAINISALRASDAPGYYNASPNGLFAQEACALARYAGISDRLTSFAVYDYNPEFDVENITAKTIAQMIWYFIEGYTQRKGDYPVGIESDFNSFTVAFNDSEEDLIFLKSLKSGRWWIKIPENTTKYKKYKIFPCSYKDYKTALENDVPERWVRAFNKML